MVAINKKGVIPVSSILIGIMLFSIFITGFLTFYSDIQNEYDRPNTLIIDKGYDQINTSIIVTESLESKLTNFTTSSTSGSDSLLTGAWGSLRLVGQSYEILIEMIHAASRDFLIPTIIVSAIIAIIIIYIVFQLISSMLQHRL